MTLVSTELKKMISDEQFLNRLKTNNNIICANLGNGSNDFHENKYARGFGGDESSKLGNVFRSFT